jgi:molybdate/tungstate transport system substrate-binding protein
LSDPADAASYEAAVAHTKKGDLKGKPIVYAITIPTSAAQPELAAAFVAFLLGPDGQKIMAANGFTTVDPAYAVNAGKMPDGFRALVQPWPAH